MRPRSPRPIARYSVFYQPTGKTPLSALQERLARRRAARDQAPQAFAR